MDDPLPPLADRLGRTHFERRRRLEDRPGHGHRGWVSRASRLIRWLSRTTGLHAIGQANALRFAIEEHTWTLPVRRPITLLQLTDLHYPGDESAPAAKDSDQDSLQVPHPFANALAAALAPLSWDICVLTGDYRFPVRGDIEPAMNGLRQLRRAIPGPIFAVLGNHDSLSMVEPMEAIDIRVLLNESVEAEPGLWFVGVDDPAQFKTDDLERALSDIPEPAPPAEPGQPANDRALVMLAHECSGYAEAAAAGIHLHLSGHGHGGQICLPGGFPLIHNLRAPRRMNSGPFEHHGMHGHVSRGTGSCGVDIRFFCPPEITLHHLKPTDG